MTLYLVSSGIFDFFFKNYIRFCFNYPFLLNNLELVVKLVKLVKNASGNWKTNLRFHNSHV